MVEATQVGSRGRHAGGAGGVGVGVALLRVVPHIGGERARLLELFERRRVEVGELLEQLRVLSEGVLQLGDSFACDLVEGGRLFVGGAAHVVARLRRLVAQRVLELDEPRPQ